MTDQQLIAALLNLDQPTEPDGAFSEALFARLRAQAVPPATLPRMRQFAPAMRMALMLALLFIALVASALAVGALLRLLPSTSPNLLYIGAGDGLYVTSRDRGQLTQLRGDGTYIEPMVSASGRYIAAGFVDVNDLVALRIVTSDGQLAGQLVGGSDIRAWSPTSDELVVVMPQPARLTDDIGRLAMVRPDGSASRIFDLPGQLIPHAVDWAPDGSRLALAATRPGADEPVVTEVWIVQTDDLDPDLLTTHEGSLGLLRWSPDGTRLAFVTSDQASVALNVIGLDGSEPVVLSDTFPLSASIDWSPAGDRLVFARQVGEQSDLFTIGSDGSDLVRLTSDPLDDIHPRWSPDGREIAFERHQRGPAGTVLRSETWVMHVDGSDQRMVRNEWLGAGWGIESQQPVDPDRLKGVMLADYALANARHGHSATTLPPGPVLIAGGADGDASDSIELIHLPGGALGGGALLEPRLNHSATALPDGRVLFIGGARSLGEHDWLSSAEIWEWQPMTADNPPSSRPAGTLAIGRAGHTATLLQDGRVLVIGGWGARDAVPISSLWEAELWDPRTETFAPAGSLSSPIGDAAATLLRDGRVLVVGEQETWLWEPGSQSFRSIAAPLEQRSAHTATLLADGRVLIAGGYTGAATGSTAHASVEIFDPMTEEFSPAGQLIEGRGGHSATLLLDGRVLIAGGHAGGRDWQVLASTELWDPLTGQVVFGPALHEARTGHVALLRRDDNRSFLDQRVLLVGGRGGDGEPLASAEEYHPFWLR